MKIIVKYIDGTEEVIENPRWCYTHTAGGLQVSGETGTQTRTIPWWRIVEVVTDEGQ